MVQKHKVCSPRSYQPSDSQPTDRFVHTNPQINIFYTAPTAIRALMKYGGEAATAILSCPCVADHCGQKPFDCAAPYIPASPSLSPARTSCMTQPGAADEPVKKWDLSSLKTLGTVGEPINPEAWKWYVHPDEQSASRGRGARWSPVSSIQYPVSSPQSADCRGSAFRSAETTFPIPGTTKWSAAAAAISVSDCCSFGSRTLRSKTFWVVVLKLSDVPAVDTYWQTETGAHVITPLAGVTPLKPGSATFPFYGVELAIVKPTTAEPGSDESPPVEILEGNNVQGILCIKTHWCPPPPPPPHGHDPSYVPSLLRRRRCCSSPSLPHC